MVRIFQDIGHHSFPSVQRRLRWHWWHLPLHKLGRLFWMQSQSLWEETSFSMTHSQFQRLEGGWRQRAELALNDVWIWFHQAHQAIKPSFSRQLLRSTVLLYQLDVGALSHNGTVIIGWMSNQPTILFSSMDTPTKALGMMETPTYLTEPRMLL